MLLHFYDINNKLLSTLIVKDFYTIDDLKINLFLDIGLGDMDLVLKKGLSSIKLEPTSKVSDYHLTRNSQIIVIPKASTIQNFCNVLSSYMKQEDNYKKYRLDVWLYKVGTEEDGEHIIIQLYNYMNKHDPERQWGIGLTTKTYDQTIYTRSMIPLDNSLYLHEVYDTTYNFIRDRCEHHQKDVLPKQWILLPDLDIWKLSSGYIKTEMKDALLTQWTLPHVMDSSILLNSYIRIETRDALFMV